MSDVIIHRYVEPNLRKLKRNKNAECGKCMMAEKTHLLDGGEGYLCNAALYDIKTLACFIPNEIDNNTNLETPINADHCVCCGVIIPEGQMVCPNCLVTVKER